MNFQIRIKNDKIENVYLSGCFFRNLSNISKIEKNELEKIISENEIKQSYLYENIKPSKYLKNKYLNSLGKRYIVVFTDNIKDFRKYGFKIIKENIKGKWFYGFYMRKDLNDC